MPWYIGLPVLLFWAFFVLAAYVVIGISWLFAVVVQGVIEMVGATQRRLAAPKRAMPMPTRGIESPATALVTAPNRMTELLPPRPYRTCVVCGIRSERLWAVTLWDRSGRIRVCRECADKIEAQDAETISKCVTLFRTLPGSDPATPLHADESIGEPTS